MAYRTIGTNGSVTSWGSANFYSTMLARLASVSIDWDVDNGPVDVGALGTTYAASIPSLRSWRARLSAFAKLPTPVMGNLGRVVFSAGGYALHVVGWTWTIETTQVHDITNQSFSSPPTWRDHAPDMTRVYGTINAHADSDTAATNIAAIGDSSATLTLTYGDESTDDTLSGAAYLSALSGQVRRGGQNTLDYSFVSAGQWTPAGTSSPLGSSALGIPLWSQGGSAAGAIAWATLTGSRTVTGADSFWTRISINCRVDQPTTVDVDIQGVGALTYA